MVLALFVAALCAATTWGLGFPPIGHMPVHMGIGLPGMGFPGKMMMHGKMGPGYGHMRQTGNTRQPGYGTQEVLTCIAKDYQDLNSQVRLTLTTNRRVGGGGFGGMGGGFGGPFWGDDDFDDMWDDDDDDDDDIEANFANYEFRIDGTFVPSIALNKAGTYYVVITRYGRTADGCSADALGPVFNKIQTGPSMGGGMGGYGFPGGMGMGMGMGVGGFGYPMPYGGGFGGSAYPGPYNSYGQNFYGGNQGNNMQGPLGQLQNPAIVGASATIYSTHINGVSKNDLLGRGIALCRSVSNGRCQGQIPYCCTIQRDSLSAMEVFVGDNESASDFDFPLSGGGNLVGVGPALGGGAPIGGALGGATGSIAATTNTGGLF